MLLDDFIDLLHDNLLNYEDLINKMNEKQGFSLETIKKFKIGYDPLRGRITFPIDQNEKMVGLKFYSPNKSPKSLFHSGSQVFSPVVEHTAVNPF